MSTICTGKGIDVFRLLALKGRVKLEKVGLKSRGGSVRKVMALELGLKASAKHDAVIAAIEAKIEEIRAEFTGGEIVGTGRGA